MGDDVKLSWFGVTAIVFGLFFFWLITEYIEPWVIETTCRELFKCK